MDSVELGSFLSLTGIFWKDLSGGSMGLMLGWMLVADSWFVCVI